MIFLGRLSRRDIGGTCSMFGGMKNHKEHCFPKFLLADTFWLRKLTTDPHILAHVNIVSSDNRYQKLDIYFSD